MEVSSIYLLTLIWTQQFERYEWIGEVFWKMRQNSWLTWQFITDWLHKVRYFSFCWLGTVLNWHTPSGLLINRHYHFLFPQYFVVCHKYWSLTFVCWIYYLTFSQSKDQIGYHWRFLSWQLKEVTCNYHFINCYSYHLHLKSSFSIHLLWEDWCWWKNILRCQLIPILECNHFYFRDWFDTFLKFYYFF